MSNVFTTFTGLKLDFSNPEAFDFVIDDIAHGLSQTCRYGGQCEVPYNVAQHSIMVSRMVPLELAMPALLHDASEAYMCDIPKPLKMLLPDYAKIEARLEMALFRKFGLPWPMDPLIKAADILSCHIEQANITKTAVDPSLIKILWDAQEKACGFKFDPSMMIVGSEPAHDSSERFMDRYIEIFSELFIQEVVERDSSLVYHEAERA